MKNEIQFFSSENRAPHSVALGSGFKTQVENF